MLRPSGTVMPLFLHTYTNKIDKKGRVSLPAAFRSVLAEAGKEDPIVFRSLIHPAIEGWSQAQLEKLVEEAEAKGAYDPFPNSGQRLDDKATVLLSDAQPLKSDGEGRIMLPELFISHAGITDKATFVGRGRTFQIWQPDAFAVHVAEARKRVSTATGAGED